MMPLESDFVPGDIVAGYRLDHRLNRAGERGLFVATGVATGDRVVVKTAPAGTVRQGNRLATEYELVRSLAGEGVVGLLGFGYVEPRDSAYLLLEPVGPSLGDLLASSPGGRLADALIALIAVHSCASALASLQGRGWCHGDVKPGNFLLDAAGRARLIDLEFARPAGAAPRERDRPMVFPGTLPFVAPEVWQRGLHAHTAASEVWALGVIAYVCLAGTYPYGADDPTAVASRIRTQEPEPFPFPVPRPAEAAVRSLIAVEPGERPQDAGLAASQLASAIAELGGEIAAGRANLGDLVRNHPVYRQLTEPPTVTGFQPATTILFEETQRTAAPATGAGATDEDEGKGAEDAEDAGQAKKMKAKQASPVVPSAQAPPASPPPAPPEVRRGARTRGGLFSALGSALSRSSSAPPPPGGEEPLPPTPPPVDRPHGACDAQAPLRRSPPAPMEPRPSASREEGGYLEIATNAAFPPQPEEAAPVEAARPMRRRAACRFYKRMNPHRNFPLTVVFSGKKIKVLGGKGVEVTVGRRELAVDPGDPFVEVEPRLPGCLVVPPRQRVDISGETTVVDFFVTPLAEGDLSSACVEIRYRGEVIESLATPAEVVARTTARVFLTLGFLSPVIMQLLEGFGWTLSSEVAEGFPLVGWFFRTLGDVAAIVLLAAVLFAVAGLFYHATRPIEQPALFPEGA